ncbi:MAG: molybdopterin-dependent oxidoreductase [Sutterellaceae bacterium]|nr:molybdopterin-dependent oxidoreductase [Sutterellaceae bacterium]MDD7442967.1 molybdopterin-dependent oxidoreductase [Sutterellaceae bacterium]MDY2868628.1 molybdopterin-dependent oxidoreductase [Mesosutterella sp.]
MRYPKDSAGTGITRRALLKAVPAVAAVPSAASLFVPATASAAEKPEDGWTICDNCNQMPMCGIHFQKLGNTVIRVESWKEHKQKILCNKGLATLQRLYNPNRLLYPMKRTNPKGSKDPGWVRISWDEAYRMIAEGLGRIRKQYGADHVMFMCGDPKEPRPAVMRLARYFGTWHYATESSIACRKGTLLAETLVWGQENGGGGCGPQTKSYLVMATNGAWSKPHGWWKMITGAKKRGVNIIVIDSRRTKTAELATIHLQPRQGTDAALGAGICRVLFEEGLYNKEFCDKWVYGVDEYRAYCKQFTPEKTEEITGVPADLIVKAARLYAKGPGSYAMTSQSLSHSRNGVNSARALLCIPAILGFVDKPGCAMFSVGPKGYIVHDNGLTKDFVDYKWFEEHKKDRLDRTFVPVWNYEMTQWNPNLLPEYVKEGKIRGYGGFGVNVMIWPQPQEYAEAIRKMDFSFATDYFYRDITHHDMDLVLPAAMNYERYAPFGTHGNVVAVRKPVKPLGEAREDWKVALDLGCIFDTPEHFFNGDVVAACDSVLKTWGTDYRTAQKNLPKLTQVESQKQQPFKYEKGLLRPDGKPGFNTPSGKVELSSLVTKKFNLGTVPEYKDVWKPTRDYPIKLINGTRAPYITHSKTRSDCPYLLEIEPMSTVDINPEDAAKRGIREGDRIVLRNQWGEAHARARVSIIVPPGTAGMQYGWRGNQNSQVLIPRQWDKLSGYAPYFETCVQITKEA